MRNIYMCVHDTSRYGDLLRAGRCGDQIQVEARFSAPVRTGTDAHPASYKRGTGSPLRGFSDWEGALTFQHYIKPRLKEE